MKWGIHMKDLIFSLAASSGDVLCRINEPWDGETAHLLVVLMLSLMIAGNGGLQGMFLLLLF